MAQKNWNKIAEREFFAMDPAERADWKDLRELVEKQR